MLLSIGLTIACMAIELLFVGWQRSSLYTLIYQFKSVKNDFFSFLLNISGLNHLVGVLLYGGFFYFLYGQVQKHFSFHFLSGIDNSFIQFGILILAADFKDYVAHWAMHKLRWAWELHKFHHSATEMTILTAYRSHAAEIVISDFFGVIIFITLGVPVKIYLLITILNQVHQKIIHSQIDSDWGWMGRYIFISPAAHRLHHSLDPAHYGKNLGSKFVFWDRLLGTYFEPSKDIQYVFGLPENEFNQKGYGYDILFSYLRSLRVAKDSFLASINSMLSNLKKGESKEI